MGLTLSQEQKDSSGKQTPAFLELALPWDSYSNCSLNVEVMGDFYLFYTLLYISKFPAITFLTKNQC